MIIRTWLLQIFGICHSPLPTLVSLQSAFGSALFIGIIGLQVALVRCFRMDAGNASYSRCPRILPVAPTCPCSFSDARIRNVASCRQNYARPVYDTTPYFKIYIRIKVTTLNRFLHYSLSGLRSR